MADLSTHEINDIAEWFVLQAIQEWGQPEAERVKAVQRVLDAAGIDAQATCWPVFGGIWPGPCTGHEAERATQFLSALTKTMQRGKFEREAAHVVSCIVTERPAAPVSETEGRP